MEKLKKFSSFIAKLKGVFPKYFRDMKDEEFLMYTNMLEEVLRDYSEEVLDEAVKEIIRTKKYMPTIAEINEICNNKKIQVRYDIIERMINDNYFKSEKEIEKVNLWISEGIIPEWLKKDMMKYYNRPLLEGGKSEGKLEK